MENIAEGPSMYSNISCMRISCFIYYSFSYHYTLQFCVFSFSLQAAEFPIQDKRVDGLISPASYCMLTANTRSCQNTQNCYCSRLAVNNVCPLIFCPPFLNWSWSNQVVSAGSPAARIFYTHRLKFELCMAYCWLCTYTISDSCLGDPTMIRL